jgi:hypothetical protein
VRLERIVTGPRKIAIDRGGKTRPDGTSRQV